MGKIIKNRSALLKGLIIVLVAVFLISALMMFLEIWEFKQGQFPETSFAEETLEYNGDEYVIKDNIETFLVLGLDKYESESGFDSYNNDKCADFLMLFVFDNNTKKCSAIQINRDTMASMNILGVAGEKIDTVTKQISLSHTYGNGKDVSCRNTANSVSSLLMGVKINHYISITMDAVPLLNDLVGGVEVTVLDDFSSVDKTMVEGANIVLSGEQALKYIRSRAGLDDSTNESRMSRQKQYMDCFYKQFQEKIKEDDKFIADASLKVSDYIVSDRSVTQLQEIAKKINNYEFLGIKTLEGETRMGEKYIEFYPNEDFVKKTVVDLFYKIKE